jgi:hypothetical protein
MKLKRNNQCCYCGVAMQSKYGDSHSITLERIDDNIRHILSNLEENKEIRRLLTH